MSVLGKYFHKYLERRQIGTESRRIKRSESNNQKKGYVVKRIPGNSQQQGWSSEEAE